MLLPLEDVVTALCVIHLDAATTCCFFAWLQVFVDGMEPVRKPLERMFEDSASEKSVRAQPSFLDKSTSRR